MRQPRRRQKAPLSPACPNHVCAETTFRDRPPLSPPTTRPRGTGATQLSTPAGVASVRRRSVAFAPILPSMTRTSLVSLLAALTATLSACGGGTSSGQRDICNAARDYRTALTEAETAGPSGTPKWYEAVGKVSAASTAILAAAPDDLRREIEPYLRLLRAGDKNALTDERIKNAQRRLVEHVKNECDIDLG